MLLLLLWLVPTAAVFSFPGQVFEKFGMYSTAVSASVGVIAVASS